MIPHLMRQRINKKSVDKVINICLKFWTNEIESFDKVNEIIEQIEDLTQYEYLVNLIKDLVKYNFLMYREVNKETIYLSLMVMGYSIEEEKEILVNGEDN